MDSAAILVLARDAEELYTWLQRWWFALHYGAGILAVLFGALAAAATAQGSPSWVRRVAWGWGFCAAFMSAVVTFLNPQQKAQSYKSAEYELKLAIADFQDKRIKPKDLRDIVKHAQQVVLGESRGPDVTQHGTTPAPPGASSRTLSR